MMCRKCYEFEIHWASAIYWPKTLQDWKCSAAWCLHRGAGPELLRVSGLPIVRGVRTKDRAIRKLVVESAAFGPGCTAVLIWPGSALMASLTGGEASPSSPPVAI
jgi:hypothetical protein